ncbi:MAG: hypothetical protein ABGY95_10000 [Rubritalea sp.]|uniref:hypothetical protein n=1 Tax=Rubritalea sp. TaxID=2109375 RepID=UPI003242B579
MKILQGLSVLLTLLCASCSAPQSPKVQPNPVIADINGLVIINNTQADITEVRLTIAESARQVNVSRVLPMSEFATVFQAKEYRGRPAKLTWRQGGVGHVSLGLIFSTPREVYEGEQLRAFLTIGSEGKVRAEAK